jgi:heme A synthase
VLFDLHRAWGYAAIVANFLAGVYTLIAWRVPKLRNRWLWWPTIIAEAMMLIQVFLGVLLVSAEDYEPPRFHMFYGFVAFIAIGLLYSYRYVWRAANRMELAYGLGGLFIMGLGIRALLVVTAG